MTAMNSEGSHCSWLRLMSDLAAAVPGKMQLSIMSGVGDPVKFLAPSSSSLAWRLVPIHCSEPHVARVKMEFAAANLVITDVRIDALKPAKRNARTHTKKQIGQIGESVRVFGFLNPILANCEGDIVAGHGWHEGAKLQGMETVPVIYVDELTSDELRAYAIAENKLSELGGWSSEISRQEFQELSSLELSFDLTVTTMCKCETSQAWVKRSIPSSQWHLAK